MKRNRTSEKGQAIVFLVVGLVVFLGFVGLAIDGGRAYSDRRYAQNAADTAALAAAGTIALELENRFVTYNTFNCNGADIIAAEGVGVAAAISRADANGFTITGPTSNWNGVEIDCGDRDYGYTEKLITVTVRIEDTTETAFAHLFFPSALEIRTEAVTWVRPPQPLAFGNAIVALNPDGCSGQSNGAGFHGNPDVYVDGGGIWSNGCLRGNGNLDVVVAPPSGIHYVGELIGGDLFSPVPQSAPYTLPPESYDITVPDCSHPSAHNITGNQLENMTTLAPGLWCVDGGKKTILHGILTGHDVTIVFLTGDLTINAGAEMYLDAPEQNPDPYPAVPGILLYFPPSNPAKVTLNGHAESFFDGTILGVTADISMLGTGNTHGTRSQIIAWNVEMGGGAETYINFEDNKVYERPSSLELAR